MTMSQEDKKPIPPSGEGENENANKADDELDDEDLEIDDDELDLEDDEEEGEDGASTNDDEVDAGADDENDPIKLKEKIKQLNAQRLHHRNRAKKLEEELSKKKKPAETKTSKKDTEANSQARSDFRFDHPELSTKIVDEIETYATAKGIELEEALKSPLIKTFVARENKRKELMKSSPGSRHQPTGKPKPKDWGAASAEEVEREAARIKMRGRQ